MKTKFMSFAVTLLLGIIISIQTKAESCEVEADCSETTTIQCSGSYHCYVKVCDYIYCDGVKTPIDHCPDCEPFMQ